MKMAGAVKDLGSFTGTDPELLVMVPPERLAPWQLVVVCGV